MNSLLISKIRSFLTPVTFIACDHTLLMANNYKTLKEEFVSNLSGGRISEINYVTIVAPVSARSFVKCVQLIIFNLKAAILLWSALQRLGFFVPYGPLALLVDFLLNVGAILLATTLYSSAPIILNILLISPAIFLLCIYPSKKIKPKATGDPSFGHGLGGNLDPLPVRPFISTYRGCMMIITCLAILAVDFKVFPRRFAKVETWGTSLMDLGVGSFVYSAGVVSARSIIRDRLVGNSSSTGSQLLISIKHSLPLLMLGLFRVYSVKGLELAEHTTEYGVHWNFFFTLALLPPSMALVQFLPSTAPMLALVSLSLGIIYQTLLEFTGLEAYILNAPRVGLISQNREGIFSFFGYLAIFVAGQSIGLDILPRGSRKTQTVAAAVATRNDLLKRLVLYSTTWILLTALSTSHPYGFNLRISRRLANLPYVLWVSAFNCAQITLFCVIETLIFPGVHKAADKASESREVDKATSPVIKAFNRNGLAIFLVANPLTGLVNLTLDTLTMSNIGALAIVSVYAASLTAIAISLDRWNVSIKL